jgi:hypothetical protein
MKILCKFTSFLNFLFFGSCRYRHRACVAAAAAPPWTSLLCTSWEILLRHCRSFVYVYMKKVNTIDRAGRSTIPVPSLTSTTTLTNEIVFKLPYYLVMVCHFLFENIHHNIHEKTFHNMVLIEHFLHLI